MVSNIAGTESQTDLDAKASIISASSVAMISTPVDRVGWLGAVPVIRL